MATDIPLVDVLDSAAPNVVWAILPIIDCGHYAIALEGPFHICLVAVARSVGLAYELKNGFEYLHKGYCNMTDAQRVLFDVEFGHGVREALIKFANIEPAANADIANHVKGEFLEYIQEA